MLAIRAEIHEMLDRIVNMEEPDQSSLIWICADRQPTSALNFYKIYVVYFHYKKVSCFLHGK